MTEARLITIVAALSLTIVRLPVFLGHKSILQPLTLLFLFVCSAWCSARTPRGSLATKGAWAAGIFVAMLVIGQIRGIGVWAPLKPTITNCVEFGLFTVFSALLVTSSRTSAERSERLVAIAMAPAVYATVNAVMHLVGLTSPTGALELTDSVSEGRPATLLQLVGISAVRVKLPLASAVNPFSVVAAAGLIALIVSRQRGANLIPRWAMWVGGAASMYCLLLGDSRGSILIVVIWALIARVDVKLRTAPLLAFAAPALLAVFVLLSQVVSKLPFSGRHADQDALSGRSIIWDGAWSTFIKPSLHQIYGWGAGGQVSSGAVYRYSFLFGQFPGATRTSAHSFVLQMLLDYGVAGLIIFGVAVHFTASSLRAGAIREGVAAARVLLAALATMILCGVTEAAPTYLSNEALLATLMIMGAAVGLEARTPAFHREPQSRQGERTEPVTVPPEAQRAPSAAAT